jgi:hypothetical protein
LHGIPVFRHILEVQLHLRGGFRVTPLSFRYRTDKLSKMKR